MSFAQQGMIVWGLAGLMYGFWLGFMAGVHKAKKEQQVSENETP